MESIACQDVTASPAEAPVPTPARPRKLAIGFQFDNLRAQKEPGKRSLRTAIAVPAYSRIVYRAGTVSVR